MERRQFKQRQTFHRNDGEHLDSIYKQLGRLTRPGHGPVDPLDIAAMPLPYILPTVVKASSIELSESGLENCKANQMKQKQILRRFVLDQRCLVKVRLLWWSS